MLRSEGDRDDGIDGVVKEVLVIKMGTFNPQISSM